MVMKPIPNTDYLFLLGFIIIVLLLSFAHSIPVPNGQLGSAEVECGEDTIEIVFITEDLFRGRIYAIGHANDSRCVSRDVGKRTTSIRINKRECGVTIRRTTNPSMIIASVKIMLSFHDSFVTKVDRGYEISCIYTQGGDTVEYPIQVSMPTIAEFTAIADLPHCEYEVLDPQTNRPAELVTVGSRLLHRWKCDSPTPDMWCMRVHTCRVDDGSGTEFIVLDERGCSVDQFLLDNLQYSGNLQAQKESHAFKFADRLVVNFECSIRIDIKDENGCPREVCADGSRQSNGRGPVLKRSRGRRSADDGVYEIKVHAQSVQIEDPSIEALGLGKSGNLEDFENPSKIRSCRNRPMHFVSIGAISLVSFLFGATSVILVRCAGNYS